MRRILTMLPLVMCISIFAQKISWGPTYKAEKRYNPYVHKASDNGIFVASNFGNNILVEKYDAKSKKRLFSQIIDPPKEGRYKVNIGATRFFGGNFVILADYYDSKSHKNHIFMFIINGKNGKISNRKVEVFTETVEKKKRKGRYKVYLSKDRSKLLVNFFAYHKKQGKYIDKHILYNEDMEEVFSHEEEINKEESNDYLTFNYIIDNEGSIYFLASGKTLKVVSLDVNNDYEKWEENLTIEGAAPASYSKGLKFTLDENGDLIIAGFFLKYKDLFKKNGKKRKTGYYALSGTCLFKIDHNTKEQVVSKVANFEQKFLDKFKSKRDIKKELDPSSSTFTFTNIHTKDDGGIILVGEYYNYRITYDRNGNITSERWHYGDLGVVNLSPEGDIIWAQRVPKNQQFHWATFLGIVYGPFIPRPLVGPNPSNYIDYFSYSVSVSDKDVDIIFNDHKENVSVPASNDKARTSVLKKPNGAVATLYKLDINTGKRKKSSLNTSGVPVKPLKFYQEHDGEDIILLGQKKSRYRYGTLSIE